MKAKSVGSFFSPKTHSTVTVFAKKNESPIQAIKRVQTAHGLIGDPTQRSFNYHF